VWEKESERERESEWVREKERDIKKRKRERATNNEQMRKQAREKWRQVFNEGERK